MQAMILVTHGVIKLTASANRPPYERDGDCFTKPQAEDVYGMCLEMRNSRF